MNRSYHTNCITSYIPIRNTPTNSCILQKGFLSEKSHSVSLLVPKFYIYCFTPISYQKNQGCTIHYHQWSILLNQNLFHHIYSMVFTPDPQILCESFPKSVILFQYICWLCDTLLLLITVYSLSTITEYCHLQCQHCTMTQLKHLLRRTKTT